MSELLTRICYLAVKALSRDIGTSAPLIFESVWVLAGSFSWAGPSHSSALDTFKVSVLPPRTCAPMSLLSGRMMLISQSFPPSPSCSLLPSRDQADNSMQGPESVMLFQPWGIGGIHATPVVLRAFNAHFQGYGVQNFTWRCLGNHVVLEHNPGIAYVLRVWSPSW